ncbi:MAG: phosphocholine cytidylyltransferase family protein [Nanoarchaeota archaeon]|nr:phosphocholine cytidylyltransferase family protein [Nanoarchaeota archaeon]
MKALILAAGIGSRLGDITKDLPKCLVPVCGKPILEYQLDALLENGIIDIIIVVGYQKEKIFQFIASKPKYTEIHFTFAENPEYAATNSSYSYWQARELIEKESYLHLNSDIVFFPDLIQKLKNNLHDNVILVDTSVKLDESMEQVVLEGKRVIFMDKANLPNAHGRGSGMAKISPEARTHMLNRLQEFIAKGDKNQHCHGLIRYALTKVPFYAADAHDLVFHEINNQQELNEAEEAIRRHRQ